MNTLIINGHPDLESFTSQIANKIHQTNLSSSKNCEIINLASLEFNPIFKGFSDKTPLEKDLQDAQNKILWADHIIITSPIWWSTYPALLKGFFDKVLLPDFAFKYHKGKALQQKLLVNKTADLILLSDAPNWYRVFLQRDPATKILKRDILGFCGIKVKNVNRIGEVGKLDSNARKKILNSF
ncbi:NAD(P)H-dependent oxidoreductase [Halobacteriovorax sp. HLS]|uniref:NAD(P)H-dependent oxidoreductase n=1 Tax=Halobacteriovorax sp. HLS TaxID=2234000 RepID=UPI000FDAD2A2|nr:NAD(P)H-dependent oxidoreductase [Halobacteriovorax sp. HLS]